MTNILLDGYNISEPWIFGELSKHIKPTHNAAIAALSFREAQAKNLDEWNALYSKENGRYYGAIVNGLTAYGIPESSISFINYFLDTEQSAKAKITNADIIYFLGGLPDKMMERIHEMNLYDALKNHTGIKMGYSAGAVIQLTEYHLSPDDDYKEFSYYNGIPYLKDFYLEVHYENTEVQNEAIQRVVRERRKRVYATAVDKGAVIVHNGALKTVGEVYRTESTLL